jgi:hypothetical protein
MMLDSKERMQDALCRVVRAQRPTWDDAASVRFRNRLLDETGSASRPLAELLIEAIRRGLPEQLPTTAVARAQWDAVASTFALQWAAERFVATDMARWATESWGKAFDLINEAPPPAPFVPTASGASESSSVHERTAPASAPTGNAMGQRTPVPNRVGVYAGKTVPAPTPSPVSAPRVAYSTAVRPAPSGARSFSRGTSRGLSHGAQRSAATSFPLSAASRRRLRWAIGAAGALYLLVLARIAWSIKTRPRPSQLVTQIDTTVPTSAVGAVRQRTGNAGVPSLTLNALPRDGADAARMVLVEPARRATGNPRPLAPTARTVSSKSANRFDEIQLTNGNRMQGRVDIVRAGDVVFLDRRTGLRYEVRKDSIEQIVTEFGNLVRFRGTTANAPRSASAAPTVGSAPPNAALGVDLRARGVRGRYLVRYGDAVATGSAACTRIWSATPQTSDWAVVQHLPNADTLSIDFEAGDRFPSVMNRDGAFASSMRPTPDQARTSTALTTRLSGKFQPNGVMALTVNIVLFRRMRTGSDISCAIEIQGIGVLSTP